jgi:hypothetical protein
VSLSAADLLATIVTPLLPAHPVVFADWESTMPALGFGFLPTCDRKLSRNPEFRCSHVPSMGHLLNQS